MIPFNKPFLCGDELSNIVKARDLGQLAGDGNFTKLCQNWLESKIGCRKALLTHSCTAALDMSAILTGIKPGDEVIMPSYTFVSTANAFVLRGGVPVFLDIREDTLNLNEKLIEGAINARTKVIVPVHYAGVSCEMDVICSIARRYSLKVVEDAAQGLMACYKGIPLGSIGDLGTLSFHETKNIISGEGGALLVNNSQFEGRSEIVREKGTDRNRFFRGEIDKYTWQDIGSSYIPGELIAAFLWAQLEGVSRIQCERMTRWKYYDEAILPLEREGLLRRPVIPDECQHNAHMYYLLLETKIDRQKVLKAFKENGILSVFHYVPLHSSPAGIRYGRIHEALPVTERMSERLIRLPLWIGLTESQQEKVVKVLSKEIHNPKNYL